MSRSPHPALAAALASHELPAGHPSLNGRVWTLNDWHGLDIALPAGGTLRFAADSEDPDEPVDLTRIDSSGCHLWTVSFYSAPPSVLAAAAVAALEAQP